MNELSQQIPAGEIAVQQPARSFALTPKSLEEAMAFADMLARSSIVPKDFIGNPGNILVAVQWGAEIGLAPLQAMQSIAIVNGRPSIWGDAALALVKGSGLLVSIVEDVGETLATCTVTRRGDEPVSRTFTLEDAKRAGLTGKQGPWTQYPKRMMQMRARSWALRDVFPDVLRGVAVAEEARDMDPPARDMGAVQEVARPVEKSRAERAREAVAARKKAATPALESGPSPALEIAIEAIHAAQSIEALAATRSMASELSEQDKAIARSAYKSRQAELQAAAAIVSTAGGGAVVDAETGEIAARDEFLEGLE